MKSSASELGVISRFVVELSVENLKFYKSLCSGTAASLKNELVILSNTGKKN